jgi:hypothetical protein
MLILPTKYLLLFGSFSREFAQVLIIFRLESFKPANKILVLLLGFVYILDDFVLSLFFSD